MKKLICAIFSGLCVIAAAGAAEDTGSLPPEGARAYLNVIQTLQNKWGAARISGTESPLEGLWLGLSLAKLVDFDGDGIPELYCGAFGSDYEDSQRLYTWDNGLKQLDIPSKLSNFGTDVSPETCLYVGENRAYLVDGQEELDGNPTRYYTKQGGGMTVALTYTITDQDPLACTLNGSAVSMEQLNSALDELTAGMDRQSYSYWLYSDMDIGIELPETVDQTVKALRALVYPYASVSSHKLSVDGRPVSISAYTINGSNYFKLRDLAMAISGTTAQFDVTWNGTQQRIELTGGRAYTPVGGENAGILPVGAQASLTGSTVWLDGTELDLTAYNIEGHNFFKLRDLGRAMNFCVKWDSSTSTVTIETAAPYTE